MSAGPSRRRGSWLAKCRGLGMKAAGPHYSCPKRTRLKRHASRQHYPSLIKTHQNAFRSWSSTGQASKCCSSSAGYWHLPRNLYPAGWRPAPLLAAPLLTLVAECRSWPADSLYLHISDRKWRQSRSSRSNSSPGLGWERYANCCPVCCSGVKEGCWGGAKRVTVLIYAYGVK